ncbi:MAG: type IX secretion system membrane protein PorP/SprF [Crocinitomicaceae bacterium]
MKKLLLLLVLCISISGFAQQLPQYSQYNRNQFMVNPAAAGMYDFLDITIGGRSQWLGITNSPMTAYAYASTVLSRNKTRYNPSLRTSYGPVASPNVNTGKLKHAIGGQVIADQYGAFRDVSVAGTYAIHLPVTRDYNISFGAKLGLSNSMFLQDRAQVLSQTPGYTGPVVTDATYDNYVANQSSLNFMEIGAGLFFYADHMYLGVTADQLSRNAISFGSGTANFDPRMHFNISAGYRFDLNSDWTMMPSALVKLIPPAPTTIEGSLQFEYKRWLWFGASYRHNDAIVGMLGCNLSDRFKLGYSFDFSTTEFNNYSSGGHEVILGLMIGR